jgi:hypothetical protein
MARRPIAYVQASWHTNITAHCRTAFLAEMARHGYAAGDVELFSVPGGLEIPLMARKLARTGRYAAVCASGLVVDGGIYPHDFPRWARCSPRPRPASRRRGGAAWRPGLSVPGRRAIIRGPAGRRAARYRGTSWSRRRGSRWARGSG